MRLETSTALDPNIPIRTADNSFFEFFQYFQSLTSMWKNYLKISLSNFEAQAYNTAINLLGLTIALIKFLLRFHFTFITNGANDRMMTDGPTGL